MAVKLSLQRERGERENLLNALLDAYPDYNSLKIMVSLKLDKRLAEISQGNNQETVIFELIEWAETKNRLLDLIWGAYEKNSKNSEIAKITYQLCAITNSQWKELYKLIINIDIALIQSACQDSFKYSQIVEVDPRLTNLKDEGCEIIESILKDNLIKKREQSSRNIPVILELAYCLSKMNNKEINSVRDDLKKWVLEVATQLNIKLKDSSARFVETKTIQPYLLISFENLGSNLLLQGELIIQEGNSETILKHESIYIEPKKKGVKSSKDPKKIGYYIKLFINNSYKQLKDYRNKNKKIKIKSKSIIIELFLPIQYILKPMETIPLPMEMASQRLFSEQSVNLGCQHQLNFRSLERFETYQNNPEYSERLENNWEEIKIFFKSEYRSSAEVIHKKFEHYVCCNEEWKMLEQRLRNNQKIGINIISPLGNLQETINIMRAIIIAGIPIALWSVNKRNHPNQLKQNFIELLTLREINDLSDLFSSIEKLRGQAYNSKNPTKLGYGLGFLCDNPNRVLSRFIEDDAFTG